MSSPTNPYGYPPNPEQPGQPGPSPSYPQPPYPAYPSAPDQPYGAPPAGYPYPPQGYPPQGYPVYQQGGMPPFAPPIAPPQRQRNTTLWVVLGIVGVLAIIACVACGIFAFGIGNLVQKVSGPIIVSEGFCTDLQSANYSAAYDRLSSDLQGQVTRDAFVTANQQRDSTDGPISSCTVTSSGSSSVQLGDTTATLPITIQRNTTVTSTIPATATGSVQLVKEGNTWKVSGVDPGLHLMP